MRAIALTGSIAIATALVSLNLSTPWNWVALFMAVPMAMFTMGLTVDRYIHG